MAEQVKSRIGFVSGGAGSMPHYNSFLPIVPKEIELDFQGLELYGQSLYEIAGKKEAIVQRVSDFVVSRNWQGVIVTAAPAAVIPAELAPQTGDLEAAADAAAPAPLIDAEPAPAPPAAAADGHAAGVAEGGRWSLARKLRDWLGLAA